MIKQVWVAVNPKNPEEVEIRTKEPNEYDHFFYDGNVKDYWVSSEYKPAMLVMED